MCDQNTIFYLEVTRNLRGDYMCIHYYKYFSPAMRLQYTLDKIVHADGYVYMGPTNVNLGHVNL